MDQLVTKSIAGIRLEEIDREIDRHGPSRRATERYFWDCMDKGLIKIGRRSPSFLRFLEDSTFADVTVIIGEEAEVFKLHRIILAAHSEYFTGAFKETFKEGRLCEITIPHIPSNIFKIIVGYFYTQSLSFTDKDPLDWDLIAKLYQTADYLLIPALKHKIARYLAKKIKAFKLDKYIAKNPEAKGKCQYDILLEGIGNVFEHSTISDWSNIKICTNAIQWRSFLLTPGVYPNFIAKGKNTSIILAALLESSRGI
ncbi:Kelch repeat and BTB (POZ) domain containing 4 [Arthrobotrys conoides]|uniref:Kelch repeat and BTB (POZ) domain containing 4 n=1 Tax=Arthrobotrys conoides TaxID=74498 RepID=A0AAN8RLT5_9PEZI